MTRTTSRRKIKATSNPPSGFPQIYQKYYANELTKQDLFKMFNIKEATFQKWVGELDLPIKSGYFETIEIPDNFEQLYYKFLNNKISKAKLLNELKVSDKTLYNWIKQQDLPLKKDYRKLKLAQKKSQHRIEASQHITTNLRRPERKLIFTFNLFGYKFSLKKEIPKPVRMIDEFEEFMEY